MERTKLLTIALVGLLVLNLVTIGFLIRQSGPPPGPGAPGEGPARLIIDRLRLDAGQQQQYRRLIDAHRRQTRVLADESAQLYRRYYGLLAADQPDTSQASSLSQQIAANQRAVAQLNYAHFRDIKALCRPDQRADFAQLVDELGQLFARPQRPGPGGPPRQ